jgi:hypothetical protein
MSLRALAVSFRCETCHAGSVPKRAKRKRQRNYTNATDALSESAGQQLSLEDQERASLGRIMSEMGHLGKYKAGRRAPRSRRSSTV